MLFWLVGKPRDRAKAKYKLGKGFWCEQDGVCAIFMLFMLFIVAHMYPVWADMEREMALADAQI